MRLTALCMCGTLLALLSLSWTTADEGDLFWDQEFGPCFATLRPEGPCRQGQDESVCPYRLSLPPLILHLPKELRELEKIVKDLQNLKDNVDELRKMCADCTTSEASHSQRGTEFSPSTTKTMTLGPKTSNSLETGPIPRRELSQKASQ
ncbi:Fibroleukin [Dissostichus eleginoides]|uniref:Fibroleukin n=1 Tax=Dissostichus eleginoides TaxID=100907 RepID=A0AAD9BS93_DISEL|nr:Fibroleukin [Dissostichus eleginoides]